MSAQTPTAPPSGAPTRRAPIDARTNAPRARSRGDRTGRLGATLAGFATLMVLWWVLTHPAVVDDPILRAVAPQHALPAVAGLFARGVLVPDALASLYRLLSGLLVAAVVGVPVGLLVGLNHRLEQATHSPFQFLRMISPLSWTPLAVAVFGIGHEPVVFLVAAAALWPIVMNTVAGVRAMDPGHVLVARSMGATHREILLAVVLPSIRPALLTGFRVALGTAWIVLVPAEMLGVRSGLGYQVLNARDQLAYDQVMAVIVVIGALGFLLDTLSRRLLERRRATPSARAGRATAAAAVG
ncbi:ABC transporter permease [Georgenia muralis]